jgi:hypothetical protein
LAEILQYEEVPGEGGGDEMIRQWWARFIAWRYNWCLTHNQSRWGYCDACDKEKREKRVTKREIKDQKRQRAIKHAYELLDTEKE